MSLIILDETLHNLLVNDYNDDMWPIDFWNEAVEIIVDYLKSKGFQDNNLQGRFRRVVERNHIVVKIPKDLTGLEDNQFESNNWNNPTWIGECTRVKLLTLPKTGIPLLMAERVSQTTKGAPEWATYYDGGQVGQNKNGVWKAFDFGFF